MRFQELPPIDFTVGGYEKRVEKESDGDIIIGGWVSEEEANAFIKKWNTAHKMVKNTIAPVNQTASPIPSEPAKIENIDYIEIANEARRQRARELFNARSAIEAANEERRQRAREVHEKRKKAKQEVKGDIDDLDNIVSDDTTEIIQGGEGVVIAQTNHGRPVSDEIITVDNGNASAVCYYCKFCNDYYQSASISRHLQSHKHKCNAERAKKSD